MKIRKFAGDDDGVILDSCYVGNTLQDLLALSYTGCR